MTESQPIVALDPADKLLFAEGEIQLDKPSDTVLKDLDKIWVGESKSFKELKVCLEIGSRYVLRKTKPIQEDFKIGVNLGNPGTYGCVKSCIERSSGKPWAVKEVNKWKFKNGELTRAFFSDLRSETRLMKEVHEHPSIIEIKCVYESIDMLSIVMTACSGGELFERIQADDGFSEKKASRLFADMLSAIFYIHSRGIMHCDLKPENFIFMNKSSGGNDDPGQIKLIDFGMAKVMRWRKYYKRMNGTPYYIAPEVLEGKYNQSCDMWSMGVILFILVFGFPPFFDTNTDGSNKVLAYKYIYKKITKGFHAKVQPGYGAWFPEDIKVSNDYKDLIARLLRTNVASRMTAEEALAHPWITKTSTLKTEPLPAIRSLRIFRRTCALKDDILRVLQDCKFLNRDQEAAVKKTFGLIDKDGDGIITAQELFEVMQQVDPNISLAEVKEIIVAVDVNGDNVLSLDEFLSARINRKVIQKEERLRKLFKCLDLDDSGALSAGEICAALESVRGEKLKKEEAVKLIEEVDTNKDGVIDYEEFMAMFKDTKGLKLK